MRAFSCFAAVVVVAASLAATSCLSLPTSAEPFQAFEGSPAAEGETALFTYPGTGSYGLLLYAVDGQPRTRIGDNRLLEGSYSNTLMCGFDVVVQPGTHRFEFYTVDTNPLQVFTLELSMEAGKTYALTGSSKAFAVKLDGQEVPVVRGEVAAIVEPAEDSPHATLTFSRTQGAMDVNAWILRIDGKIRQPMYKRHPRWMVMNYSGLASGIVNSIGGGGMLIQPNVDAKEGNFGIRLSPGMHRIEYQAEALFLGKREMGEIVRSVDVDLEAGKAYRIVAVPSGEKIEGIAETAIQILPE
jgi:hypothetical protein